MRIRLVPTLNMTIIIPSDIHKNNLILLRILNTMKIWKTKAIIKTFLKIAPIKKKKKNTVKSKKVSFMNYQMKYFDNSPKM